jgi:hypothetical protein
MTTETKISNPVDILRNRIQSFVSDWQVQGLPSRAALERAAEELLVMRKNAGLSGLWDPPPQMITTTLDDGIGQGLEMIHRFAEAVGIRLCPIGLVKPPAAILFACRQHKPALLGLTVLQLDSENDLAEIVRGLPESTRLIAGGPAFRNDPEMARRVGLHTVARHAGDFLAFLLTQRNLKG